MYSALIHSALTKPKHSLCIKLLLKSAQTSTREAEAREANGMAAS